jgi:dipeptidyl aminopeptidase/acylaminoacyl peptidase
MREEGQVHPRRRRRGVDEASVRLGGFLRLLAAAGLLAAVACGCSSTPSDPGDVGPSGPEHDRAWGIYRLDPATDEVDLIFSSENSLHRIDLNADGTRLVFQEDFGPDTFTDSEICVVGTDGTGYARLTANGWLDAYPCWSPDDSEILYLSWPDYPANTMDIYLMNAATRDAELFYDSGFHDGDCAWEGADIVFTRESQIWIMDEDGTNARQVTDYALAGQQGAADLPFGDYDPRLRPGEDLVCFDRMVDDRVPSGNYDFFLITSEGEAETRITFTEYSQFITEWSRDGDRLVFTVAAIEGEGRFDIYTMNADGTAYENVTPADWPAEFLCTHPVFSADESRIYFVGQWWE